MALAQEACVGPAQVSPMAAGAKRGKEGQEKRLTWVDKEVDMEGRKGGGSIGGIHVR